MKIFPKHLALLLAFIMSNYCCLFAQDWTIGLNQKTILTKSSSFSQHGFAVINDQVFTPLGIELTRNLSPKLAIKFNAATSKRNVELVFDSFFTFDPPSERKDFNSNVENNIYFFSTALHYEVAAQNHFRIRPLLGLSILLEKDQEISQSAFFKSVIFENEIAITEFSQRLINEINPFFDIGFEVLIPVLKRIDLGISYIYSRPIFGAYYTQNFDFAQLIGSFDNTNSGLQLLPQRYVVNERFTDKLVFDSFSFSLSYTFK